MGAGGMEGQGGGAVGWAALARGSMTTVAGSASVGPFFGFGVLSLRFFLAWFGGFAKCFEDFARCDGSAALGSSGEDGELLREFAVMVMSRFLLVRLHQQRRQVRV